MRVCDCSDDSIFVLARKPLEDKLGETNNKGIKNIICCKSEKLEDLNEDGKALIDRCVEFLLFDRDDGRSFPKTNQNQFHTGKYITIWSYIYDYLKIGKNSGYDYWLMNYLDHVGIIEHGSGIRCGWYAVPESDHIYSDFVLSDDAKNKIINWAENCDDEV